ncbi:MAG: hypothetical protein JXA14_25295 [Anaerolineae bacterium]|nr:hypothetical protein [Anaerolineae bacterium]
MRRSAFLIRLARVSLAVILLGIVSVWPAGASSGVFQGEPTPRATPTPAPFIALSPTEGVVGTPVAVTVTGSLWVPGVLLRLFWDGLPDPVATVTPGPDGTFAVGFITPTTEEGEHIVSAAQELGGVTLNAQATFVFLAATPTHTLTPSNTPTNTPITPTPTDTLTPTPKPPTSTPTNTATPSPSPTLRPVTPMVTITPIPPTTGPTRPPSATRTNTPRPGTPTNTLTPSVTPTPSNTPGPGTPSATPEPSATPVQEIVDTGGGWGTLFLWGFVLAGLVVVFRLLRVRSLAG